jgi:AraC-like DNA-binding protein
MAILGKMMPKIDLSKRGAAEAGGGPPKFFSAQIAQARRFHLQLRPDPGRRLSVVCGGCERCAPDYQIRRSTFPYFGLEFVAGGKGSLALRGGQRRLVPGTVFSYGPRVAHHITTAPDEPLVKYFVDFAGTGALKLLRGIPLAPGAVIQTSAPAEVMPIFDELIANGMKNTGQSLGICAALLEALLLKLAETRMPPGSVESAAFETYQRCRRELEEGALKIRSLQELAARCRVDGAYLCRLFRRFDHESPYHRLMRLKMSHAAARMQAPGVLVKQIAAELGFEDPYHFSRAFKSVFGLSPTKLARER